MTPIALALCAAAGVYLVYTTDSARPTAPGPGHLTGVASRWKAALAQAGIGGARVRDILVATAGMGLAGGLAAFTLFGGILPAAVTALFAGSLPVAGLRTRWAARRAAAMSAWPRMLEELRVLTSAAGHSIPQALVAVGRRAPVELRDAFAAAEREWLLSTDFERTVRVLKERLADPTADAACETLLVAHEVGGVDLDRRLAALIDDRILDSEGRRDARAKQAGARFARRFVLIVPLGMALAGMSVGPGRAAYQTGTGQALVAVAIALVIACWIWAGRIMALPAERRVFDA